MDEFSEKVRELMQSRPRLERSEAVRMTADRYPELHREYVINTQTSPQAERLAREKFGEGLD